VSFTQVTTLINRPCVSNHNLVL